MLLGSNRPALASIYGLLFWPMDSTRYFEFDFVVRAASRESFDEYLDISSPRLLPLLVMRGRRNAEGTFLNPDREERRCRLRNELIETSPLPQSRFDLITSVSVFEHIPDDSAALKHTWELLRSGGRLILTLPCAATFSEQYISESPFGLLPADSNGYVFWQRFYDNAALEARIYHVLGRPARSTVFGEKKPGTFQRHASRKRSDPGYPFWREPISMGRDYEFFPSVDNLPGEGVIGLEFVKP